MGKQKVCCSHSRCSECMVGVESPWLRPLQRGICTAGPLRTYFIQLPWEKVLGREFRLLIQGGWEGLGQGDKFLRASVSSSGNGDHNSTHTFIRLLRGLSEIMCVREILGTWHLERARCHVATRTWAHRLC